MEDAHVVMDRQLVLMENVQLPIMGLILILMEIVILHARLVLQMEMLICALLVLIHLLNLIHYRMHAAQLILYQLNVLQSQLQSEHVIVLWGIQWVLMVYVYIVILLVIPAVCLIILLLALNAKMELLLLPQEPAFA